MWFQTARVQEQEERKQWGKQQKTRHTYGQESDDDDDDDDDPDSGGEQTSAAGTSNQQTNESEDNSTSIANPNIDMTISMNSKRSCSACGSLTHQRRSHRDCLFHKKRLPKESDN